MKRFFPALALAAIVGGQGCVVTTNSCPSNQGDVIFRWNFGSGQLDCTSAGIDTVRITIDQQVTDAPCIGSNGVEGITLQNFVAGTYSWTAQGYNGASTSVTVFAGVTSTQNFSLVAASGTATSLAVW